MIDATVTNSTFLQAWAGLIALFFLFMIAAGVLFALPKFRSTSAPMALFVIGMVIGVSGNLAFIGNLGVDKGAAYSEKTFATTSYVTQTDLSQWLKKDYGITASSHGYDTRTDTPTVTVENADKSYTTYNIRYGDFETKDGHSYLNANLYLDGKPVQPKN